jgi:hypothetical protein
VITLFGTVGLFSLFPLPMPFKSRERSFLETSARLVTMSTGMYTPVYIYLGYWGLAVLNACYSAFFYALYYRLSTTPTLHVSSYANAFLAGLTVCVLHIVAILRYPGMVGTFFIIVPLLSILNGGHSTKFWSVVSSIIGVGLSVWTPPYLPESYAPNLPPPFPPFMNLLTTGKKKKKKKKKKSHRSLSCSDLFWSGNSLAQHVLHASGDLVGGAPSYAGGDFA